MPGHSGFPCQGCEALWDIHFQSTFQHMRGCGLTTTSPGRNHTWPKPSLTETKAPLAEDVLAEDILAEDILSENVLAEDVQAEDVLGRRRPLPKTSLAEDVLGRRRPAEDDRPKTTLTANVLLLSHPDA